MHHPVATYHATSLFGLSLLAIAIPSDIKSLVVAMVQAEASTSSPYLRTPIRNGSTTYFLAIDARPDTSFADYLNRLSDRLQHKGFRLIEGQHSTTAVELPHLIEALRVAKPSPNELHHLSSANAEQSA